jgi:hypothetical protein
MEERKAEDQLFPGVRLLAVVEEGVSETLIGTLEVGSKATGRLSGQLDTVLED